MQRALSTEDQYLAQLDAFKQALEAVLPTNAIGRDKNSIYPSPRVPGDPAQTLARALWNIAIKGEAFRQGVKLENWWLPTILLKANALNSEFKQQKKAIDDEFCLSKKIAQDEALARLLSALRDYLEFFIDHQTLQTNSEAVESILKPIHEKIADVPKVPSLDKLVEKLQSIVPDLKFLIIHHDPSQAVSSDADMALLVGESSDESSNEESNEKSNKEKNEEDNEMSKQIAELSDACNQIKNKIKALTDAGPSDFYEKHFQVMRALNILNNKIMALKEIVDRADKVQPELDKEIKKIKSLCALDAAYSEKLKEALSRPVLVEISPLLSERLKIVENRKDDNDSIVLDLQGLKRENSHNKTMLSLASSLMMKLENKLSKTLEEQKEQKEQKEHRQVSVQSWKQKSSNYLDQRNSAKKYMAYDKLQYVGQRLFGEKRVTRDKIERENFIAQLDSEMDKFVLSGDKSVLSDLMQNNMGQFKPRANMKSESYQRTLQCMLDEVDLELNKF